MTTIGTKIREFRSTKNLTQQDVADAIGVSKVTVLRWENGSARPSPLAAEKLEELGLRNITHGDTNLDEIPRIRLSESQLSLFTDGIDQATKKPPTEVVPATLTLQGKEYSCIPAPYVANGPSNQLPFFKRLYELQSTSSSKRAVPLKLLANRLSSVQSVDGIKGATSQFQLESPRSHAAHWNANYGPHGWHRYIGRFPPHLVRALLNHFALGEGSVVCDPFAGSGTTLVEARLLGIKAIGIEICPLSQLITAVKSQFPVTAEPFKRISVGLRDFFEDRFRDFHASTKGASFDHLAVVNRPGNILQKFTNYEKWLTAEAMLGVSIVLEFANTLAGYERNALLVALSSRTRSIGNVDVDVARAEYRKTPRENVDVLHLVTSALKKMHDDIDRTLSSHSCTIGPPDSCTVINADVREAPIEEGTLDCIVTSPPYGVEASSYLRSHLLSYRCLSPFLREDPYAFGQRVIGSEYICDAEAGVPNFGCQAISKTFASFFSTCLNDAPPKKLLQRAHMMMHFFDDMSIVAGRFTKWLKRRGHVAFVVGNKMIGDHLVPTDEIVTEIFASHGLKLYEKISHKLKCNNTNSQVPWQERVIQGEHILLFRKKA